MLSVEIDEINGLALLKPEGPLSKHDFESAAKIIDPYIEKTGQLRGLIIHTKAFRVGILSRRYLRISDL